jgi:hypothetical protein
VLAAVVVGAGCSSTWHGTRIDADHLLAVANVAFGGPSGPVLVDVRTGVLRRTPSVLPARRGLERRAVAVDAQGDLWATFARGPRNGSRLMGGDPQPMTCGGEVLRVDHRTGAVSTVYEAPRDEYIAGSAPAPDGQRVAFLSAPCERSYLSGHIRVATIDGHTWELGAGSPPCRGVWAPTWAADGAHLAMLVPEVASVEPLTSNILSPDMLGRGVCTARGHAGIGIGDASQAGPLPTATLFPACDALDVARREEGFAAVVDCAAGELGHDRPTAVVVTDADLHEQRRMPIGSCARSASLAISPSGDVAVSAYGFCDSPGPAEPASVLWVGRDDLRPVARFRGGSLALDDLAW